MTRSTHSKSRKPRNQKQISQKRGTRKLQRGGWGVNDLLSLLRFNKAEPAPSEEERKGDALKAELTSTLKTLTTLLPKVKLCAAEELKRNDADEDARRREQERLQLEEEEKRKEDERLKQAAASSSEPNPMGGGMGSRSNSRGNRRSNRRGRGRAPPKKGSKKGMVVVGPRKGGPIIF
jgi:hypothetical protein